MTIRTSKKPAKSAAKKPAAKKVTKKTPKLVNENECKQIVDQAILDLVSNVTVNNDRLRNLINRQLADFVGKLRTQAYEDLRKERITVIGLALATGFFAGALATAFVM